MKISILSLILIGLLTGCASTSLNELTLTIEPTIPTEKVITLNGEGTNPIWQSAKKLPSLQWTKGFDKKNNLTSEASIISSGKWLILGLLANENSPLIADESIHNGNIWFDDNFSIQIKTTNNTLNISITPTGTLYVNKKNKYIGTAIITATKINQESWRAELAIDLTAIGIDINQPLMLTIKRERQQRNFTPFDTARMTPTLIHLEHRANNKPVAVKSAPAQLFYKHTALNAAKFNKKQLTNSDWARIKPMLLQPETDLPSVSSCFNKTVVRSAITKDAIEIKIDCYDRNMSRVSKQKNFDWAKDVLEIALGPESYNYLHFASNPQGSTKASIGKTGGRRVSSTSLPEKISITPSRDQNKWTLTYHIPLKSILSKFKLPATLTPTSHPWRIQVARTRPSHTEKGELEQSSLLAVTQSFTFHCPQRFALLKPVTPFKTVIPIPTIKYAKTPPAVITTGQSKIDSHKLVSNWIDAQTKRKEEQLDSSLKEITTADGWKKFATEIRNEYMQGAFPATDGELPTKTKLNAKIVYSHTNDGFTAKGLIFQSQAGLPVPATLCVPDKATDNSPAMIIIPAHHTQRNHYQLYNLGANFARAGGVALITESIGSGERGIASYLEHKNSQRNLLGTQLILAGEEIAGWNDYDIKVAVDYLYQRGDIDRSRVGIIGAVAGGGDVASQAALVDPRITLSIPFNFSAHPAGKDWYDLIRSYPGNSTYRISPFMMNVARAPALLIQAEEFEWKESTQKRHHRYKDIYKLLKSENNLTYLHGYKNGHVAHIGRHHRIKLYKILNKWWDMQLPTNKKDDFIFNIPISSLECFHTKDGIAYLNKMVKKSGNDSAHNIAAAHAKDALTQSRKNSNNQPALLRENIGKLLGDTNPVTDKKNLASKKLKSWKGATVEGIVIRTATGYDQNATPAIAIWLLKAGKGNKTPLVIATAQSGKATFLTKRDKEIKQLIANGISVALVDLRGCGETTTGARRFARSKSQQTAIALIRNGSNMPAAQLKDLRTAIYALASRKDIDSKKIALWGEGFTTSNGNSKDQDIFQETNTIQASPTPHTMVEPMGAWLSLLAGLYPVTVDSEKVIPKAILIRGGIASFLDIVKSDSYYVPLDAIIPGLVRTADVTDVINAVITEKITLIAEDMRDARNRRFTKESLQKVWGKNTPTTYQATATDKAITSLIELLK